MSVASTLAKGSSGDTPRGRGGPVAALMGMGPRLELSQRQSLVMSQSLQQAIRLLALSSQELEAFVADEVDRNPLLDFAEGGGGADPADGPVPPDSAPGEVAADQALAPDAATGGAALDDDPADRFPDHGAETGVPDWSVASGPAGGSGEDGPDFDRIASNGPTLYDHLLAQAGESLSGAELLIAEAIIAEIGEAGYFTGDIAVIAARLGVPVARVEVVLAVIQCFDPSGVGARTLAECLAIQAREADRYDPCMAALIANLDKLARGQVRELKRICGVDDEDFADMVAELRGYDPKPGCRFEAAPVIPVTPDVMVVERGGVFVVELTGAAVPSVLIDRRYRAEVAAIGTRAARTYLNDCLQQANWLIRALDQRRRSILAVATEIVRCQQGFFRDGVGALRPLTLRMVAEVVGLHESTVSRVTANKYLHCARGTFELRYFFSSAIAVADGGDAVSANAVKAAITRLIEGEGDGVLSDDTLVTLLKDQGYDIARRTVAKYREALGYGSSVQRRRQKAIGG